MLLLGHTGITLGAVAIVNGIVSKNYDLRKRQNKVTTERLQASTKLYSSQEHHSGSRLPSLTSLANHIDIRLLLIGSLLPDIIDKPIGQFLLRDSLGNGRIFGHTLAFLLLITLAGCYLYRSYGKKWLLVLSIGTFTHLILDQMWLTPQTLLWPLYGWTFQRFDPTPWIQNIFYSLRTDPAVYVPELVGAAILIWFVVVLVRRRQVYAFIRNGRLS
jgi:inner membrane protein